MSGVDGEGRSCLVEVVEVVPRPAEGGHGVNVARVYATTERPPPARAAAFGDAVDIRLAPGTLRWMVVDHPVSAGGLVVMPGVDHAMRAGPAGLRLVVVSVGTPPPAGPS